MKIKLILNGKTEDEYIIKGFSIYEQRLKHYISFETIVLPALKNTKALSIEQQKQKEGVPLNCMQRLRIRRSLLEASDWTSQN